MKYDILTLVFNAVYVLYVRYATVMMVSTGVIDVKRLNKLFFTLLSAHFLGQFLSNGGDRGLRVITTVTESSTGRTQYPLLVMARSSHKRHDTIRYDPKVLHRM